MTSFRGRTFLGERSLRLEKLDAISGFYQPSIPQNIFVSKRL